MSKKVLYRSFYHFFLPAMLNALEQYASQINENLWGLIGSEVRSKETEAMYDPNDRDSAFSDVYGCLKDAIDLFALIHNADCARCSEQ